MKRDPKHESLRLHRARRAAERAELDAALSCADAMLADAKAQMLRGLMQLSLVHPRYAACAIGNAVLRLDDAREALRKHFDTIGSKDHEQ